MNLEITHNEKIATEIDGYLSNNKIFLSINTRNGIIAILNRHYPDAPGEAKAVANRILTALKDLQPQLAIDLIQSYAEQYAEKKYPGHARLVELAQEAITVIGSDKMLALCLLAHNHNMPYSGPIFDMEKAHALLAEIESEAGLDAQKKKEGK